MSVPSVYQINLQQQFGGGEVYTRFFTLALIELGYRVVLFVSRKAGYWNALLPSGAEIIRVDDADELPRLLPQERSLVVTQTALDADAAQWVAERHLLCGFVHMPLHERNPAGFKHYRHLLAVSQYVLDSVKARGYDAHRCVVFQGHFVVQLRDLKPRAPQFVNDHLVCQSQKFIHALSFLIGL